MLTMKRLLVGMLALTVLMFSCKGKQAEGTTEDAPQDSIDAAVTDSLEVDTMELLIMETPMPRAADELFDDFLFNFAANVSSCVRTTIRCSSTMSSRWSS